MAPDEAIVESAETMCVRKFRSGRSDRARTLTFLSQGYEKRCLSMPLTLPVKQL